MGDGFAIETLERQQAICIRGETTVDGIRTLFDRGFGTLGAHLARTGTAPTGAPYGRFRSLADGRLAVELGFPVARAVGTDGEILAGELPAGEAAVALHVGAYEGLERTRAALGAFVRDAGRVGTGEVIEFYLDDPRVTPVDERRTRVVMPLAPARSEG